MSNYPAEIDLSALSQREQGAFDMFSANYRKQNAAPEKPNPVDIKSVGSLFWLYLATSIAAVILASMRTASMFFAAAVSQGSTFLGYIEAIMAILAIEGGLVVYAAARAINRKQTSDKSLITAIVIMVLISMVAGLGQSIGLINMLDPIVEQYFQYALAVLLGAGTSIVAFVGGEVLGQQIVIVTSSYDKRVLEFGIATKAYEDKLQHAWQLSDERKFVRGDLKRTVKSGAHARTVQLETNQPSSGYLRRPPVQTTRIFAYMDDVWLTEKRIPTMSEVTSELSVAKSTASEIRKKWLELHKDEVPVP